MDNPTTALPNRFGSGRSLPVALAEARDWIAYNDGAVVPFCTNTMLSRGTVYFCRVENGRAIVERTQGWWAMSYGDILDADPQDLGEVVAVQISGCLSATIGVKNDKGFVNLKMGRG